MNTFWLKLAGGAVLVVGIIVGIGVFTSSDKPGRTPEPQPEPKQKTIYDQWDEDEKRLKAEPQFKQPPVTQTQPSKQEQPLQQPTQVEPPKPQFKKLGMEDEIQAQRLLNYAIQERKMGRLPAVKLGYKKMLEHCRQIIQRWPESEYAFKAKRLIADIPERYHKMYNITPEEIDLGNLK